MRHSSYCSLPSAAAAARHTRPPRAHQRLLECGGILNSPSIFFPKFCQSFSPKGVGD